MAKAKNTKTIDGVIYSEDMSSVIGVESKDIKRAVIADDVRVIEINAFKDCAQLEEISIPNSIHTVRTRAFQNCTSLFRVLLGDNMSDWLNASWFKDLPSQYELICNEKSETFKIIKRSTRLKAHVKSIALSDAKSEKQKQVQNISIDAVVASLLKNVPASGYKIMSSRKTATSVLFKIGKNCGVFKFGMDSAKWLPKIPKIIEILSDQEKEGKAIYKELKENKLTLADLSCAAYIPIDADASGNFNLFMSGRFKDALRIRGNNTLSIFGARSIGCDVAPSVQDFESIVLNKGLEKIEATAFYGCENLKSITIPEGVKTIDYSAFKGCTSLTSLTLPESLEEICSNAFECCSSLSSIHIPKTIKKIGDFAFRYTKITNLETSFFVQDASKNGESVEFTIKNGIAKKNRTLLYAVEPIEELVIDKDVEEIADYAFQKCQNLKRVKIGEGVKKIGIGAFKGCSFLQEVSIPDSIEQIEGFVFENTAILSLGKTYRVKSAQIRNGGKVVDFSIKDGFAMEDDTLAYVTFNKRKLLLCEETLVIPDFVRRIDTIGDACKNVVSIFVPTSVEEICSASFRECENLLSIEYGGTKAQWKAIQKSGSWDLDLSAKSVRCSDGEINI